MLHNNRIFAYMGFKINLDAIGITASLACAIHCAVLPLVMTSLPILGINIIHNHAFEYGMIFLAMAIGSYSLYHGYKKHHHQLLPLVIFIIGVLFLFAKQRWHDHEMWLLIPAVLAIVSAHYVNYLYCKKANHCHADDCNHGTLTVDEEKVKANEVTHLH